MPVRREEAEGIFLQTRGYFHGLKLQKLERSN